MIFILPVKFIVNTFLNTQKVIQGIISCSLKTE